MKEDGMKNFYLFTDTTCNFNFYEYNGMTRRCEKREKIEVDGQMADMKFFYDKIKTVLLLAIEETVLYLFTLTYYAT